MAGSEAEERIRAKAEARLRRAYPQARIIHELVVGDARLDLAAVEPDRIVLAEIKSERDTLTRLAKQVRRATAVTDNVLVYAADKHRAALHHMGQTFLPRAPGERHVKNPDFMEELRLCTVMAEDGESFALVHQPSEWNARRILDPTKIWNVMWSSEMKLALAAYAGGVSRSNMYDMTALASELMSGRQIRRAVCAALRQRSFPRADPPVES